MAAMGSRSLILHRLKSYLVTQIRHNHRRLSSASSYALQEAPSSSPSPSPDSVHMTDDCVRVILSILYLS